MEPYALDIGEEADTLQADVSLLVAFVELRLWKESDHCEQKVNKHLLAELTAFFASIRL